MPGLWRILVPMEQLAGERAELGVPPWAVPAAFAINDAQWLWYAGFYDTGSRRDLGSAWAVTWTLGPWPAPVTGREERPVTAALAEAEKWTALAVVMVDPAEGRSWPEACAKIALTETLDGLGVLYRTPQSFDREFAYGAWIALRWILGHTGGGKGPLELPTRLPNGEVASAEDICWLLNKRRPDVFQGERERELLWERAVEHAAKSRRLAQLIERTAQRVAAEMTSDHG